MFYVVVWKQRSLADESLPLANFEAMWLPEKGFAEGTGRPQSLLPTGITAMTEHLIIQLHKGWSILLSPMAVLHHSAFKLYAADISDLMNSGKNFISLS